MLELQYFHGRKVNIVTHHGQTELIEAPKAEMSFLDPNDPNSCPQCTLFPQIPIRYILQRKLYMTASLYVQRPVLLCWNNTA